jgi:hypothetical protein
MDQMRWFCVDLPTQERDVRLDNRRLTIEVVTPNVIKDLRPSHHVTGIAHQKPEQLVLGQGKLNDFSPPGYLVCFVIEDEISANEELGLGRLSRAAQDRLDPGDEFFDAEGLGEVVIAPNA